MKTLKETPKMRLARMAEYWHKRCRFAEKCIDESLNGNSISEEQALAIIEYYDFIKNNQEPS